MIFGGSRGLQSCQRSLHAGQPAPWIHTKESVSRGLFLVPVPLLGEPISGVLAPRCVVELLEGSRTSTPSTIVVGDRTLGPADIAESARMLSRRKANIDLNIWTQSRVKIWIWKAVWRDQEDGDMVSRCQLRCCYTSL